MTPLTFLRNQLGSLVLGSALLLAAPGGAGAQHLAAAPGNAGTDLLLEDQATPTFEVDRDGRDFRRVAPAPTDPPLAFDTALVFSNTGRAQTRVICKAFDDQGQPAGRAATSVPGLGLRYLLASDFTGGASTLGQVQCATQGRVLGSAFLLGGGAGITEVLARQADHDGAIRIRFPVVFVQ